jgi:YfiH family protein
VTGDGAFRLEHAGGALVVRSTRLDRAGVAHVFSTMRGAEGPLDLGAATPRATQAAFLAAAGLGGAIPLFLAQVHGTRIVDSADGAVTDVPPEADGALARADATPARAPVVRTADCVPLLLADEEGRVVAAIHAGWRGIAAGIGGRAVAALAGAGVRPERMLAALGPAVGPCCYPVGDDVARRIVEASSAEALREGARVDLRLALRSQLVAAGMAAAAVTSAPWCTACERDLFWSHRRQGARRGSQLAAIAPRRGSPASRRPA